MKIRYILAHAAISVVVLSLIALSAARSVPRTR
jgi:hypothetical protein